MKAQWSLEGDLLEAQMKIDKLKKKTDLTDDEKKELADLETRRDILSKQLRKERMKGGA